jgi:hypothetical protein
MGRGVVAAVAAVMRFGGHFPQFSANLTAANLTAARLRHDCGKTGENRQSHTPRLRRDCGSEGRSSPYAPKGARGLRQPRAEAECGWRLP